MVKHHARNTGDDNQNGFRDFLETKQHNKGNRRHRCVPHADRSALVKNVTTSTFARHTELFLTKNSESSARNPAMAALWSSSQIEFVWEN